MDNHIVIVPFNLPNDSISIYEGENCWMDRRMNLFKTYTLPSFNNQSDTEFHLIILLDPNTPKKYLNELKNLEKSYNFFNILYTLESKGKQYENQLLELYMKKRKNNSNIILSSRCDNDDSIHTYYIETIKQNIENFTVLSLAKGLYWDINSNIFLNSIFPTGPFLTTQSTLDNFLNPRYDNHHDVVKNNKSKILTEGFPMWVQIIHGENLWNRLDRMPGTPCEVNIEELKEHFNFIL